MPSDVRLSESRSLVVGIVRGVSVGARFGWFVVATEDLSSSECREVGDGVFVVEVNKIFAICSPTELAADKSP